MNIIVAMDSFKGSLTSLQAGTAVKEAAHLVEPQWNVRVFPLADGGEGTVDALSDGLDGKRISITVTGPLFQPVEAVYCILADGTAVIEMSAAAGLTLVPVQERDPMKTTTVGVGEMIKDAIARGCRKFLIGIGGSATNDGGIGMLSALGYSFLDCNGNSVPLCANGLERLATISSESVLPQLKECTFRIACDVTNPLLGSNGCSYVFGPQKGASLASAGLMDAWLQRFAVLTKKLCPGADPDFPGAGAAGGLGFAFLSYTRAFLESGVHLVLDQMNLEKYVCDADLVITGEGRLDAQTPMGKAPIGVAGLAKKYGKIVIAFSGCVCDGADLCNEQGIDSFFPILRNVCSLEEALACENAYSNLVATACQVFRLIKVYSQN